MSCASEHWRRPDGRLGSVRRGRRVAPLWLAALALVLAACANRQAQPRAPVTAVPPPAAPAPGRSMQEGRASWYGREQHGHLTASGQRFDMNALTAAHRTLPMGTRVRVTNVRNGRSVIVRI